MLLKERKNSKGNLIPIFHDEIKEKKDLGKHLIKDAFQSMRKSDNNFLYQKHIQKLSKDDSDTSLISFLNNTPLGEYNKNRSFNLKENFHLYNKENESKMVKKIIQLMKNSSKKE